MTSVDGPLLGRQIQSHRKVDIRIAGVKSVPDIVGCVFMPNGNLVVIDHNNNKIILLDCSLSISESLESRDKLWDVAVFDEKTVIVTIPNRKQLQLIQVFPQLKLGEVFQLDKTGWGVAVFGQEIYVSCHGGFGANDGEVRVLDNQCQLKRRLGIRQDQSYMFLTPYYITVNTAGDKIFVSDAWGHTVTCMKADDGSIFYQYKHTDTNNFHGIYRDDGDNVIVCDYMGHNIHVVTSDGKKNGTLLSPEEGLKSPSAIAYRKSDGTLMIGGYQKDLIVCQLSN